MTDNRQTTDNRQQRLVIRVSRDSLSFSTTQGVDIIYDPYPVKSSISSSANLREALRSVPMLSKSYSYVLVMVDSPVLMVPLNLFHEEDLDTLYHHTFTKKDQTVVMYTVIPELSAVALFAVSKDLRGVITDAFHQVRFTPAVASVWRHLHERSFTGQRQKLYGYFHDRQLEVFSFVQNRFKFCNTFNVTRADDALFYLLAVWKQLGLVPEHDELHLVGDFSEKDALMKKVQTFVKRVFYIIPSGEFNRAPITQIAGMPYDLITLYQKGR